MDTKYLEIIKAPVITEKSGSLGEKNQYVFKVSSKANKIEIKQAIEKIFKVHVKQIRTLNVKPFIVVLESCVKLELANNPIQIITITITTITATTFLFIVDFLLLETDFEVILVPHFEQ